MTTTVPTLLLNRTRRLRLLAHTRRMVLVILPLGAGMGLLVAAALRTLGSFEPWVGRMGGSVHLGLLLPAASFAGATHNTLLVPVVFLAETTAQAALVVPALIGCTVAFLVSKEQK